MSATKVVISVSGGVVNAVCTDSRGLEVYLVDFDELEADPKADCKVPYVLDSLRDFRSAVKPYLNRYRGLKRLVARITE